MFLVNILIYHVADLLEFVLVLTKRNGHHRSDCAPLGAGVGALLLVFCLIGIVFWLCLWHVYVWMPEEEGTDLW